MSNYKKYFNIRDHVTYYIFSISLLYEFAILFLYNIILKYYIKTPSIIFLTVYIPYLLIVVIFLYTLVLNNKKIKDKVKFFYKYYKTPFKNEAIPYLIILVYVYIAESYVNNYISSNPTKNYQLYIITDIITLFFFGYTIYKMFLLLYIKEIANNIDEKELTKFYTLIWDKNIKYPEVTNIQVEIYFINLLYDKLYDYFDMLKINEQDLNSLFIRILNLLITERKKYNKKINEILKTISQDDLSNLLIILSDIQIDKDVIQNKFQFSRYIPKVLDTKLFDIKIGGSVGTITVTIITYILKIIFNI